MFLTKEQFKEVFISKVEELYAIDFCESTNQMKFHALSKVVNNIISKDWINSKKEINNKEVYYFSMEFLMGRMFSNNIYNLGMYNIIKDGLCDLNIDVNELENEEKDCGLGNGGLGRLAACFLDSAASLGYTVHGNTIRYKEGFFEQNIINNSQIEKPDFWLDKAYWEVRDEQNYVDVGFYGEVSYDNEIIHSNQQFVRGVPYDMAIVGANNNKVNTLKMWSCEQVANFDVYKNIDQKLYPDDTTYEGKELRLKQQYFFSCCGVRYVCRKHKKVYNTLENLNDKIVFQINDTHPVLVILELMRILIDEEKMLFDKALDITTKTCAYTNHTILAEALEKWDEQLFKKLLPRLYDIVVMINNKLSNEIKNNTYKNEMLIIKNSKIHMANLAFACSFSVNGVAMLHTEILKNTVFKGFNEYYKGKINNKTNGITHRRWCKNINPNLVEIFDEYAKGWEVNPNKLLNLNNYIEDIKLQNKFDLMKKERKEVLSKYIFDTSGVVVDSNSIFDIHVKRLHEYKRQLLNAFHILYLYNKIKNDVEFKNNFYPQTFIFGAKAAPTYYIAKEIIRFINVLANKINSDSKVSNYIKVIFIQNYNVSKAELLIPACDISEQISTASKEASGTGNMKFMMNGAITLGTLDGANVEISELVGGDNIMIFGLKSEEVQKLENENNYRIYQYDSEIEEVLNLFSNGFFVNNEFESIKNYLLNEDKYFILYDFNSYKIAQSKLNQLYKDRKSWLKKSITNSACSGFFSSDRTINDYNKDIWKL